MKTFKFLVTINQLLNTNKIINVELIELLPVSAAVAVVVLAVLVFEWRLF